MKPLNYLFFFTNHTAKNVGTSKIVALYPTIQMCKCVRFR